MANPHLPSMQEGLNPASESVANTTAEDIKKVVESLRQVAGNLPLDNDVHHVHHKLPPGLGLPEGPPPLESKDTQHPHASTQHPHTSMGDELVTKRRRRSPASLMAEGNYHKHPDGSKTFLCDHCDFKTNWENSMISHVRSRHINTPKTHQCEHCLFSSHFKQSVILHTRARHVGEKPFNCPECEFRTSWKRNLSRHIRSRHAKEPKAHRCPECDYSSERKQYLMAHIRSKHTGERPFSCNHCEYNTVRRDHLKKHTRTRHGAPLPPDPSPNGPSMNDVSSAAAQVMSLANSVSSVPKPPGSLH